MTARGTIKTDQRRQTAIPGVYAAGDIIRGASLVVWAVRDGIDAAAAINADLAVKAAAPLEAAE